MTMGVHTLEMIRESPPYFIYSKRKGKILIKLFKKKKMVVATEFKLGSQLCKGKVLSHLTSVVLKGDHLVGFAIRMLVYIVCFLRMIKS